MLAVLDDLYRLTGENCAFLREDNTHRRTIFHIGCRRILPRETNRILTVRHTLVDTTRAIQDLTVEICDKLIDVCPRCIRHGVTVRPLGIEHGDQRLQCRVRCRRITEGDLPLQGRIEKILKAVDLHIPRQILIDDHDGRISKGRREVSRLIAKRLHHIRILRGDILHKEILLRLERHLIRRPENIPLWVPLLRCHALEERSRPCHNDIDLDARVLFKIRYDEIV